MAENGPLIPKHGGYRKLKSFQVAQLIYDITVRFCDKYIDRRIRTYDQMIQAARSGVQNIAEGSQASGTSRKTELTLTSVARSSLEELRLDYEDFLRQRGFPQWERFDPRNTQLIAMRPKSAEDVALWAKAVRDRSIPDAPQKSSYSSHARKRSIKSMQSIASMPSMVSRQRPTYPEIAANGALALITVAAGLLDRQLVAQSKTFLEKGGFTESLYRKRLEYRTRKNNEGAGDNQR